MEKEERGVTYMVDPHPKRHDVKTDTPAFEALVSLQKPFDLRKNDRDYQAGDIINQMEWNQNTGYTGRTFEMKITWVLYKGYGLPEGYCIMTVVPLRQHKIDYSCRFQSHTEIFCDSPGPCTYKNVDVYPDKTYNRCTKPFVPNLDMVKTLTKIKELFDQRVFVNVNYDQSVITISDAKQIINEAIKEVERNKEGLE